MGSMSPHEHKSRDHEMGSGNPKGRGCGGLGVAEAREAVGVPHSSSVEKRSEGGAKTENLMIKAKKGNAAEGDSGA